MSVIVINYSVFLYLHTEIVIFTVEVTLIPFSNSVVIPFGCVII